MPLCVRRDQLRRVENRSNLSVQFIEVGCGKLRRRDAIGDRGNAAGFVLDQQEDRNVLRMRLRPGPHLLQTLNEELAIAQVNDMNHLQTRPIHLVAWIEHRIGRKFLFPYQICDAWMSISAAFRIGCNLDLHLAHTTI